MATEQECLDALCRAADQLDTSPTKAEYEQLGLTPASATIIRVLGGWNRAKRSAGLAAAHSRGARTQPKPDTVNLPDDVEWADLSVDQRWHYRNRDWNTQRTLRRRDRYRAWLHRYKGDIGCARCSESDPACLDFHHRDPEAKERSSSQMVSYGYGKTRLNEEIDSCAVLCANCHRKEHYTPPAPLSEPDGTE